MARILSGQVSAARRSTATRAVGASACPEQLQGGRTRVMVATDIAARGIDIEELPLVINYDLPRLRRPTCTASDERVRAGAADGLFRSAAMRSVRCSRASNG
ncbi:MAG: helicase-related protein [Alistipes sp.]